ncbi:MAG TPA: DEAD/DEAH box helicase [Candidatus Paceibacterota bacterium]
MSLQNSSAFSELGIAPRILETLSKLGYKNPTPIQEKAIPTGIEGKDMMGIAQTGTGKTLAFAIPMLQRLVSLKGQGLVILPTRELALQVDEVFRKIGHGLGLRIAVLIGGTGMGPQISALRNRPHIIIATPGRLIDHLEQRYIRLDGVKILVLDEADRMLDMGFAPQLNKIMNSIPRDRQTMLFSATMPREITAIATRFMKLPLRIEVDPAGTTVTKVTQEIFIVGRHDKERLLDKMLSEHRGTTLVFTRTKWGAKKLARAVKTMGHSSVEIHGNRSLGQRKEALDGFKTGRYRVLVATDIASRGIDVVGINLVVNYDLPMDAGDYVHRIGRTARAGAGGHAISFVTPEEKRDLHDIERFIKKTLPVSQLPELPPVRYTSQNSRSPKRNLRYGHR